MMYLVQDVNESQKTYIASFTTQAAAEEFKSDLIRQDKDCGTFKPGRYKVTRHGICYNDYSAKCGFCTNCICMLEHPDADCPLVKKRAAAMAAGEYADNPAMLQPEA